MNPTYIIASSKPWHLDKFIGLKKNSDFNWLLVENKSELLDAYESYKPKYIFFLHWNWIVPTEIVAGSECVCFHMTDVPYGRGGSPLQNLILKGHKRTKLTALQMTDELDAGPVYCKRDLELSGSAQDIYIKAGEISFEIVDWIVNNKPVPVAQTGKVVNFERRKPYQSEITEPSNIKELYDFIRMLDAESYPQAFINYKNFKIEFSKAEVQGDTLEASVNITLRSNGDE